MTPGISFSRACQEDAQLLVQLYNAAFLADYQRYGCCPGYGRSREEMERSLASYPKWIISVEEQAVGVLSVREEDGTVWVGCLCVIPQWQGRGIGTRAMRELDRLFPERKVIELVTPADKAENIRFYTHRCGFKVVGEKMDGPVRVAVLRKEEETQ